MYVTPKLGRAGGRVGFHQGNLVTVHTRIALSR